MSFDEDDQDDQDEDALNNCGCMIWAAIFFAAGVVFTVVFWK